jgi:hypothetical protein
VPSGPSVDCLIPSGRNSRHCLITGHDHFSPPASSFAHPYLIYRLMDILSLVRISYFLCNSYSFPSSVRYRIYFTCNPATVYRMDLHCRHNLQLAAAAYTFVAVRNFMCRISLPTYLFISFSNYTLSYIVHTTMCRYFLFIINNFVYAMHTQGCT